MSRVFLYMLTVI